MTKEALATAWQESVSFLNAKAGRSTAAELGVDFDTFLRLNVRLDLLMDDIEASKAEQQPNEVSQVGDMPPRAQLKHILLKTSRVNIDSSCF